MQSCDSVGIEVQFATSDFVAEIVKLDRTPDCAENLVLAVSEYRISTCSSHSA